MALAASVCFVGAIIAHRLTRPPVDANRPAEPREERFDALRLTGVDLSTTEEGRATSRLRIGELTHRKRTIGPLTLNPVKEIEGRNVQLEFQPSPADPDPFADGRFLASLGERVRSAAAGQNLGLVSRVTLRDVQITSIVDASPRWRFRAGRLESDDRGGTVRIEDRFLLQDRAGRRLLGRSASWDIARRRLRVHGEHVFEVGRTPHRGRDATFTLDAAGGIVAVADDRP